ncbi:alpha/beta fold hydrolase [Paeniglutamicibacter gangotriensis]|uniref:Alpha/beta hydrolase fold protein n=2 Tax=Paeniglutamicibacter gangotriensis TaxID=254787 RepID=M7MQ69_9MICC|nr:alpha/beta hydrolase [Paeniglutamicibacter gangotriensis]EMQ98527.1 alpha/beta hydrolase fold protein [Paeniglutamicibacter gangotriensis Lz1y]KAA0975210.1 alpha/beta hydrolase [Paeniglutamicibacter gangotriensis]
MPHAVNPVDAQTIYFDASDTGAPPVLMLHGSALSRSIWRGLGYVKALEPEFDTIRMDLRGHGRSDKPHDPASYCIDLVLQDVLAVLEATGHESVHLVGYSFGARVGLSLAIKHPAMVRSLTMLGGTHAIEAEHISTLFFEGYLEALKTGDMNAFIAGMESDGGKLDPATRLAFASNDALALAAYFESTEAGSAVSELLLAQMKTPTLLMTGTRDRPRIDHSRVMAAVMPHARLVELEGRTHGGTLFPPQPILEQLLPFLRATA